ncbi:MAG: 50S ribosomal protein L9 [Desulfohalobiaceae bacterium]|nr:50S ribosomal protein L9 [Desulfohalobiaceae bacterium]
MQIILRTDIENLGKLGDMADVKPGYARNYLIPQGKAMPASRSNLKKFEQERAKLQARHDKIRFQAKDTAQQLEQVSITIPVRVGESDKLYGSITSQMIADELAKLGYDIDKKKIELENPIRSLGEFSVPIKLYPDVRPELKVIVVRHGEEQPASGEPE